MLVMLSSELDRLSENLLQQTLTENDAILVTNQHTHRAFVANPFAAKAYVRTQELAKLGGHCHASWVAISESQWLQLTLEHDKTITW